jgi:hypothetical protein
MIVVFPTLGPPVGFFASLASIISRKRHVLATAVKGRIRSRTRPSQSNDCAVVELAPRAPKRPGQGSRAGKFRHARKATFTDADMCSIAIVKLC